MIYGPRLDIEFLNAAFIKVYVLNVIKYLYPYLFVIYSKKILKFSKLY